MTVDPQDVPSDSRITPALNILLAGRSLLADQMSQAMHAIVSGWVSQAEIAAFLALLGSRVPTAQEIVGAVRVMRSAVERVPSRFAAEHIIDTAGTGGAPKTFNVSTAAAIVAAAAGFPRIAVAKHGNRSRTGRGSAEVLQMLGVNIDAPREVQSRCLNEVGVCFCFAAHHHPASRYVMPVRAALGFPTLFNLIGPLVNPAGALRQVMGVYDRRFMQPVAEALRELGAVRAMVLHSNDGLDECSIAASTNIFEVHQGRLRETVISPRELGLDLSPLESITARDLPDAASMIRSVIDGSAAGPTRDMTLLNTAATLVVAGLADTFEQGIALAAGAIDSHAAAGTLEGLIARSHAG